MVLCPPAPAPPDTTITNGDTAIDVLPAGALSIPVLHRDEHLVALHKPPELSLLADRSGAASLWDALPALLGTKPYLVHRLDRGTSGVLLVALDQPTQSALARAFNRRKVRKFYIAWVAGEIGDRGTRTIDLPLKPGRKSRFRVAGPRDAIVTDPVGWRLPASDPEGLPSVTRLRVLARTPGRTLVLLEPLTGRTHQLRVHLAWIGHPILGDTLYGKPGSPAQAAPRLMLHAHRLAIPGFGSFRAPAPLEFAAHEPAIRAAD
jgi:tRNA pseudouridine32 synthase/23S rRNA pseudouridine746 synthase/23S rRNA pseudouridine1911/1915/1917 synthase